MIYGNQTIFTQIKTLIDKLLNDESQTVYPFILIAWPAHVGKASVVREIIANADLNSYDVVTMQDLSDDWLALKDKNDLTGTSHSIQIEVESKRSDITLADKSTVHNWWVREIQDWLVRSPLGRDKVVLIEAIERATWWASNALLKTLEEPLPHRLMIATTHALSQLPATIVSRAMVFQVHELSDDEMQEWVQECLPESDAATCDAVLLLAAGRPWLMVHYQQLWILDDVIASWIKVQQQIKAWVIAPLYQQMVAINKSDYLSVIIDALLVLSHKSWDRVLYDSTFDLIRKQSSNVNIDNLLFEWCGKIVKI